MYKRDIYLDIDDELNNYIKSVELDSNSRVWHFHLTVDYEPLDLTGKSVHFIAEKPDKTNVLNDCKIVDAKKGVVEVELTRQVNAIPGRVKCLLKIIGDEGFVLKTKTFVVDVSKTLSDDAVVSSDELGALEVALGKVQDIDNRFAQTNAQLSEIQNEKVNIKTFGAKGDGITDDTQSILDALDFLENKGGLIYFPKGTYLINRPIAITSGVTITGETRDTCLKANSNSFRFIVKGDNVTISHLTLDGNAQKFAVNKLIDTDYENKTYIKNLLIDNCNICNISASWVHGISLSYTTNTVISNNTFDGFICTSNEIVGDLNGSARAINVGTDNHGYNITNNIFKGMVDEEDSDFIHVIGEKVDSNDFPFIGGEYKSCSGVIKSNSFHGFMKSAIKIQAKDVVIDNNLIDMRGLDGKKAYASIRVQNSENCVVTNNKTILDSEDEISAIYVLQRSKKSIYKNNIIQFTGFRNSDVVENDRSVLLIHHTDECIIDGIELIGKNDFNRFIWLEQPGRTDVRNIIYDNTGYCLKSIFHFTNKDEKANITFENINIICEKVDKPFYSRDSYGGSIYINNIKLVSTKTVTEDLFRQAELLNYETVEINNLTLNRNFILNLQGSKNIDIKDSLLKGMQLQSSTGFNVNSFRNTFTSGDDNDYCYLMILDESGSYKLTSTNNVNENAKNLFYIKNDEIPLTTSSNLNVKTIDDIYGDYALTNYANFIYGSSGVKIPFESFYVKTNHTLDYITSGWQNIRKPVVLAHGSMFYQNQSGNNHKIFLVCEKNGLNKFIEMPVEVI